ncbi:unnamed protein product [Prorocentrum cordatum]|uniref:Uncharacterized protein n=1 Tax=Prorocentrum cordatum TaxID=2364126 RepID=A0ABN9SQ12_9DINO|nr:unnamed protein product [Polarella glacialis]
MLPTRRHRGCHRRSNGANKRLSPAVMTPTSATKVPAVAEELIYHRHCHRGHGWRWRRRLAKPPTKREMDRQELLLSVSLQQPRRQEMPCELRPMMPTLQERRRKGEAAKMQGAGRRRGARSARL